MKFIFTCVCVIAMLSFVKATTNRKGFARFEKNIALNDLTCSDDETLYSKAVKDELQCALWCVQYNTCYTIVYSENTGNCYGCNTVYSQANELSLAVGNVHYQIYPACEYGWTGFMRSCYKLSSHAWFFNGAADCVSEGGHAVYIETSAENEFLKDFVKADSSTWAWYIGITECAEQGVWRNYGSDDLVRFTDFKVLNRQGSCCALFFDSYDYQWAQYDCENRDYSFPTVCEITVL